MLFHKVCSIDTLYSAWFKVKDKKSSGGIDGQDIKSFERDADQYLEELKNELETGQYISDPYYAISVPKSIGSKEKRNLGMLTVRDKIAQQAVRDVIEPIFESIFLDISYGYRPQRGPQRAIRRISHMINHEKKTWVTICDIDNFFDTLIHSILLDKVKEKVPDPEIIQLISLWIRMGHVDKYGKWKDKSQGVPQGGVLSPLLSNVYLHSFDLFITERGYGLVRYSDDFTILNNDQASAQQALRDTQEYLSTHLHLKINPNPSVRSVNQGFTYMGFFFKGENIQIDGAKYYKIKQKLKFLCNDHINKPFYLFIKKMNQEITGLINYYRPLAPKFQIDNIDEYYKVQLSIIVQRKKDKGEFKTRNQAFLELKKLKQIKYRKYTEFKKFLNEILDRVSWQRARQKPEESARPTPPKKPIAPEKAKPPEKVPHEKQPDTQGDPFEAQPDTQGDPFEAQPDTQGDPFEAQPDTQGDPFEAEPAASKKCTQPIKKEPACKAASAQVDKKVAKKKKEYYKKRVLAGNIVIETPYHFLGLQKGMLAVKQGRKVVKKIALAKIDHISINAKGITLSSDLINSCAQRKIPIDFFDFKGEPTAKIFQPKLPDTDVSLAQLNALQNSQGYHIATAFVQGKINNQINTLKYFLKYRKDEDTSFAQLCEAAIEKMEIYRERVPFIEKTKDRDLFRNRLLGDESAASIQYWGVVKDLLKDDVEFKKRVRKGAQDPVNCSLNYGYGILYPRIWQAVIEAGLSPLISFLHKEQKGEPTLTYDLIEEFRPYVVDRTVFALFTRGSDIKMSNKFICTSSRKLVADNVLTRLTTPIPFRGQRLTVDEIISHQARALTKYLVGKKRIYNPFVGRY